MPNVVDVKTIFERMEIDERLSHLDIDDLLVQVFKTEYYIETVGDIELGDI